MHYIIVFSTHHFCSFDVQTLIGIMYTLVDKIRLCFMLQRSTNFLLRMEQKMGIICFSGVLNDI